MTGIDWSGVVLAVLIVSAFVLTMLIVSAFVGLAVASVTR